MERIYYTGDVANQSGWFTVEHIKGGNLHLVEVPGEYSEGRSFIISSSQVGDKYEGHGGTRFVTETAYKAWRAARLAQIQSYVDQTK